MSQFPSGTVTFLFVEFLDRAALSSQDVRAANAAVEVDTSFLAETLTASEGAVFRAHWPVVGAAFANAVTAVTAALEAWGVLDRALGEVDNGVGARMALYTGVVIHRDGDYVGQSVKLAGMLLAAAHENQILLSHVTQELVHNQLPDGSALRDLGAYHLGEESQPKHIFQLVTADLPSSLQPLQPPARRPNNLPVSPTPLIGREREVTAVASTLRRADARLLTITGPGGIGKTRLALQAAGELQATFTDGVFFVDLGSLRDPDLVFPTIASTLGTSSPARQSPVAHLCEYLTGSHRLLVLDSFEHLLPAAADLGSLLASTPQLKLLVTSRAVLNLTGEHTYPVGPLAVPDSRRAWSSSEALAYSAVSLFITRARAARPDLAVSGDTMSAVVEICRRLDGLPLAIELAAVRCKYFSPPVLLEQLKPRLPLLTGGPQDLPPRQRTLRNTLDWSYELLDNELQRLFRQLSVFEGGFTLEAAGAVCTARRHGAGGIPDELVALADQSLLRQPEQGVNRPRFTMLDTVREYAFDLLERFGDTREFRQRHAAYFLQLAETVEPELMGSSMRKLLDRLEAELPNLRAALSWMSAEGDTEAAARLASSLGVFWRVRHRFEGSYWLQTALENNGMLPPPVRARALHAAGMLAQALYELEEADARLQQSLELYQELGDERGLAGTLTDLGTALATLGGNQQRARALLEKALKHQHALENELGIALALYGLGWIALRAVLADQQKSAWPLTELDLVARSPEALDAAHDRFAESLRLRRTVGEPYHVAWALASVALVAAIQGDFDTARALTQERLGIERALANPYGVAASLQQLGVIALRQGELDPARAFLIEGLTVARERGDKTVIALLLMGLGEVRLAQGEPQSATASFEEALTYFQELGDQQRIARVHAWLAQLALDQEDAATACTLAAQSVALARAAGTPETIAACLAGLADGAARKGMAGWASQLWAASEHYGDLANSALIPVKPVDRAHLIQSVRALLGEGAFAAYWAEGQALTPEEALVAPEGAGSPRTTERTAAAAQGDASSSSPPAGLTPRQYEVLLLVAEGLSNAQIAEQLAVSKATVKAHLTATYRKLGVSRRTAAIRHMIDHGYI